MNYLLTFLYLLVLSISCYGSDVKGTILDQEDQSIIGATVVLLDLEDSSLVSFALSNTEGKFEIHDVTPGNYLLQVSFVSHGTLQKSVSIGDIDTDLGILQMEFVSEVLQEITVKAEHIPMGIIGDTISYNASAFKTRPGASVEDLLRKLPGIEVARDGSIKAMGEEVKNVLVEGKEFFGDDPKIATRNLDAETIDKVEVFDKKSEIAEFTGIDDGADEKTINLELKEGHKSGGFGKVNAEGAGDSRYYGKLNYNRFSPTLQASIIGNANNVNEQAFTFNEYIQFMGGFANAMGNLSSGFNFGEFGGGSAPQGITDNISSGLNFNYDFSKKFTLNSHYFMVNTDLNKQSSTLTNQFSDDADFVTDGLSQLNQGNNLHRLNTKLKWKPSPLSQFILKNNLQGNWNALVSKGSTLYSEDGIARGTTTTFNDNDERQLGYEGYIQWRRKFEKKGRSLISSLQYQTGSHNQESNIMNFSDLVSTEELYQTQFYDYKKNILSFESAYTEPLGKQWYLGMTYKLAKEKETPTKLFYDVRNEELFPNDLLSSGYSKGELRNQPEISIRKNSSKLTSNFRLGSQWTMIEGMSEDFSADIIKNTFHLLPAANMNWDPSSKISMTLDYSTNIQSPTLNQLAPLADNSNPNLFRNGNPELAPEYHNNLRLFYRSIDQFSFKNLIMGANVTIINNRIVDEVTINEDLTRSYRPINTNRFTRLGSHISYSSPIRALKLKYNTRLNFARSSYNSFLNGTPSDVIENKVDYNLNIENRNKDHLDISTGVRLSYTTRQYDINEDFDQQYFNYSLFTDASLYINDEWTIGTTIDYMEYSGEFFSSRQRYTIWNASITKTFNENRFGIELKAFDILQQNQGISRSGGLNSLYEVRYNTLSQYFSLGMHYKLGKKKTQGTTIQF